MIVTTNSNIPAHWNRNQPARSHNGQYSTDGQNLYSYNKRIGLTLHNGDKVLLDYTAPSGHMVSMTTSHHVSKARCHADTIMNPDVALCGGVINKL